MEIVEQQVDIDVPSDPNRSGGLHASNIIRAAGIKGGIIKPFGDEDSSGAIPDDSPGLKMFDDDAKLRMMLGVAWEAELLRRLPHLMGHPGEYHVDGIAMSPDAVSWEPVVTTGKDEWAGRFRVHEIKATYTSARKDPTEMWAYLTQLKMYCRAVGTTAGALHVCFLAGDYGRPLRPMYKCWHIEFTPLELEETWSQIVGHAKAEGRL